MTSLPNKLWFLKHIRLFDDISPSEMQAMEKITHMKEIKKRQPLYLPGDPSSNVYLLKRGRVKIANTAPSGKEVTFDILEARRRLRRSSLKPRKIGRSSLQRPIESQKSCVEAGMLRRSASMPMPIARIRIFSSSPVRWKPIVRPSRKRPPFSSVRTQNSSGS